MSVNDIKVKDVGGLNCLPTRVCQTAASTTGINAGELVKLSAAGAIDVISLADGDGVIGTTTKIVGLAKSTSNHTASAVGTVEVYCLSPQTILAAKTIVAADVNTAAKVLALENDLMKIDVTTGVHTLDTTTGHVATHAFEVVGGDTATGELFFKIKQAALDGPNS